MAGGPDEEAEVAWRVIQKAGKATSVLLGEASERGENNFGLDSFPTMLWLLCFPGSKLTLFSGVIFYLSSITPLPLRRTPLPTHPGITMKGPRQQIQVAACVVHPGRCDSTHGRAMCIGDICRGPPLFAMNEPMA